MEADVWKDFGVEYTPENPIPDDSEPFNLDDLDIRDLRIHPSYLVDHWAMAVLDIWLTYRGGDARGPLPDRGGYNGQAAWLMAAIDVCQSAASAIRKRKKEE